MNRQLLFDRPPFPIPLPTTSYQALACPIGTAAVGEKSKNRWSEPLLMLILRMLRDLLVRQCCYAIGHTSREKMHLALEEAFGRPLDRNLE